ncbi:MAG: restriction endonuclease subunit S [Mesorhizobium sp.]|uniref:restriction endonuclease subunit S n=1 Tax=Mesorhizobium sp. TaxID=1871066 RepID=UPI000FEA261F|nr:restriction endonuclease subunit S [Mesorhizobium sp.]RWM88946.1 MAG: restriction endonuclease subunit S [Mesorhizobium sp.]
MSAFSEIRLKFTSLEPLKYGANAAAEFDDPDWPRFVRITDVDFAGRLREGTFRSLPPDIAQPYLLSEGDILLARSGATVGKSFIYKKDWGDACYAGYLIRLRASPEFNARYIYWYLQSSRYWADIDSNLIQSTIQNVSAERFANFNVPSPSIETQHQIARFLDAKTAQVDALIEKKRALLDRLAEKRRALITRAVTKGLNPAAPMKPSGIDWLGDIPAHWETGNIRRFARMKTGHTPSRSKPEYWDDCTIPWFTLADVWQLRDGTRWCLEETAEKISELGLANSAAELLPAGTVVFSRTASVGYSGIMPVSMATSQDFWNWVCGPKLSPEYLLLLFRSMTQKFEESTSGSTHKTIYQGIASGLEICVPPIEEQRAISTHVFVSASVIDRTSSKVRQSIAKMIEYRAALITAAVTGRLGGINGN